jgi:hypothetical protein
VASPNRRWSATTTRGSRAGRRPRSGWAIAVLVAVLCAGVTLYLDPELADLFGAEGANSPDFTHVSKTTEESLAVLDTLPVKGRAPKTGYDREGSFGDAWIDVDGNGCDTRNDILARDLQQTVVDDRCHILSGTITDPYTGDVIQFVRGESTSSLVQIDHLVALSNAWQTGAQQLTRDERIAFANDPANLLAVDGSSNAQKGDGDTATWLPESRGYRCDYVRAQIDVKAAYSLWVTAAERDAMLSVLGTCPTDSAVSEIPAS